MSRKFPELEYEMRKISTLIWLVTHLLLVLGGVILLVVFESGLANALGVGIVGSGFVGLSLLGYVYLTHRTQERLESLASSGIEAVFPYRSATIRSEYETRLKSARKHIDIMGFGLSTLLDDFGDQFEIWGKQAAVRILLLDPEFPTSDHSFAAQRDEEEGDEPGTIYRQVRTFARESAEVLKQSTTFEVRLYRAAPSINYFRIDDLAFWGPYFVAERSRNMPTLLVSRSGLLFEPLAAHFNKLWSDRFSRELPASWLQEH